MTVMQAFPQYDLDTFYSKHYYEGGLHLSQLNRLYLFCIEQENRRMKFDAALQGVDLDKEMRKQGKSTTTNANKEVNNNPVPIFGDPDQYDDMSEQERQELTEKMMKKHRNWVQKQGVVGS